MAPDTLWAIRRALAKDDNPRHLIGFASTLSPAYPALASMLYAKAQLLELRARSNQARVAAQARERLAEFARVHGERAAREAIQPLDARANLEQATDELARGDVATWQGVRGMWRRICPDAPIPWLNTTSQGAPDVQDCRRALERLIARRRLKASVIRDEVAVLAGQIVVDSEADLRERAPEIRALAACIVEEVGPDVRIVRPLAARLGIGEPLTDSVRLPERARWVEWHKRAEKL